MMDEAEVTYEVLAHMLHIVLVEIRHRSNPEYAKVNADIFHNVPTRIVKGFPPSEIYESMLLVADRHDVRDCLVKQKDYSVGVMQQRKV